MLIVSALVVASLPPTALGCGPVGCGCDCGPDIDLPDINLPGGDLPDRDVEPPRQGEDGTNVWVIVVPSVAILMGALGAAYFLGTRRR